MTQKSVSLKPHEDRRLRAGHLWFYTNEIDTQRTPLRDIEPGTLCRVEDARGAVLGLATVNPHTLLCGRLLTRRADAQIDADWFTQRIVEARTARDAVYPDPFYRLVYGEADALPGLVVDRYGDYLAVQITTAGMECFKTDILSALQAVFAPRGMWIGNDVPMRELEGLPAYTEAVGEVPDTVEVVEGGVRFAVSLKSGQKTGWFYDQRDNRDRLARYAHGARVLDVCCYAGGWGLRAMAFGASDVAGVDTSAAALEQATANAAMNGYAFEPLQGRALDVMKRLNETQRRFELVIVDPPALVKRKKDHTAGLIHYQRLNRAALDLVAPGGVLVSCSCSFHVTAEELQRAVLRASREAGKRLAILEQGGQGPDHPVHPAIPETRYLKALFCRVGAE
ncbi:MAG: class I SAM-dependent rRNA methyltransferase [Nevskiaceae bacterium]|nr:MAG: class I SAM-dependent rRNA methyltransferase [Nevskiaceae bacterium]TBR73923.1 MAG: class I SAM-dependent rRNA methyltransferase [Nevskiaceae bacterium]